MWCCVHTYIHTYVIHAHTHVVVWQVADFSDACFAFIFGIKQSEVTAWMWLVMIVCQQLLAWQQRYIPECLNHSQRSCFKLKLWNMLMHLSLFQLWCPHKELKPSPTLPTSRTLSKPTNWRLAVFRWPQTNVMHTHVSVLQLSVVTRIITKLT